MTLAVIQSKAREMFLGGGEEGNALLWTVMSSMGPGTVAGIWPPLREARGQSQHAKRVKPRAVQRNEARILTTRCMKTDTRPV